MGRNISIAISAKDNFSSAIATMRNSGIHFNKDLEEMQQQLNAINKNRTTLKLDTNDAKKSLQTLQKEYQAAKKSGDGMVSEDLLKRLDEANEAYEQARRNLSLLDKSARDTEKSMTNMTGAFSKAENKAGLGGIGQNAVLKSLAAAGVTKMLGDLGTQVAGAYIGSAYGSEASSMFSSILSGATSGAAAGTMLGGVEGTAIGAAGGAIYGIAQGATQQFQKEDEAFQFQTELLNIRSACGLFTMMYTADIDHVLMEAKRYQAILIALHSRKKPAALDDKRFWTQNMAGHAKVMRGELDPTESVRFQQANQLADRFDKLAQEEKQPDTFPAGGTLLDDTQAIRDFKAEVTQGLINCRVQAIMLALYTDHLLREANHFLFLLKS